MAPYLTMTHLYLNERLKDDQTNYILIFTNNYSSTYVRFKQESKTQKLLVFLAKLLNKVKKPQILAHEHFKDENL